MSTIIQIKRSQTTDVPSGLANGELAYSFSNDKLFIGQTDTSTAAVTNDIIGGRYFTNMLSHAHGVLTSNSALVTDSNSHIDQVITGGLILGPSGTTANAITGIQFDSDMSAANGSLLVTAAAVKSYVDDTAGNIVSEFEVGDNTGSNVTFTTGSLLSFLGNTGEVQTSTAHVEGTNTAVTFGLVSTGVQAGTYGNTTSIPTFTVDEKGRITAVSNNELSTNLSIAGDSGTDGDGIELLGQTLTIAGNTGQTISYVTNNQIQVALTDSVAINTDLTVGGNTTVSGDVAVTGTSALNGVTATTVQANGTLDVTGDTTLTTVSASGTASLNDVTATTVQANGTLDVTGDTTLTTVSASGAASLNGVTTTTLDANSAATFADTVAVTGDTTLSTVSASGAASLHAVTATTIAANSTITGGAGLNIAGTSALNGVTSTSLQSNGDLTVGGSGTVAGDFTVTETFAAGNTSINGSMEVAGDLTVSGNLSYLSVENLVTNDPLMKLGNTNTADTVDLGFYGMYDGGTYAGLARDASDGKFRLFTGLGVEPGTTVDTAGSGYTAATLVVGSLELADSDISVAQGGTGANTIVQNGVVFGQGTDAVRTAVGTEGKILQALANGQPVFSDLDGGSF